MEMSIESLAGGQLYEIGCISSPEIRRLTDTLASLSRSCIFSKHTLSGTRSLKPVCNSLRGASVLLAVRPPTAVRELSAEPTGVPQSYLGNFN